MGMQVEPLIICNDLIPLTQVLAIYYLVSIILKSQQCCSLQSESTFKYTHLPIHYIQY